MFGLIKFVLTLAIVLAVFFVGYNLMFGTEEEKQGSRAIISKVHDLSASVIDLLKSEKDKFNAGKYDSAVGKLKGAFAVIKEQASKLADGGKSELEKLQSLEERERQLETQIENLKSSDQPGDVQAIRDELLLINRQTDELASSIESDIGQ